jgi:hypothetical protein
MSIYRCLPILGAKTSTMKATSKGLRTPRPPLRSLSINGYGSMRSFIEIFYELEKVKHYERISSRSCQGLNSQRS